MVKTGYFDVTIGTAAIDEYRPISICTTAIGDFLAGSIGSSVFIIFFIISGTQLVI